MTQAATFDPPFQPLVALRAAGALMRNPEDTRQVFVVMASLRGRSGGRLFARFAKSEVGAMVLAERRRLLARLEDREALARLPDGSLGRAYLAFMQAEDLSAAGLVDASEVPEAQALPQDLKLFRDRMRDMHDLTHVLTGYGRDALGEVCLLAFMYRQTGNRGGALIALMGMGRFPKGEAGRMARRALFEAFRNGPRTGWLPGLDWEAALGQDLQALRQHLGVKTPAAYQALQS